MMDKKNMYPHSPDVDVPSPPSYEAASTENHNSTLQQEASSSNYLPSAPPSIPPSHFSYGSVQPQPIFSYQGAHYQHQHQLYEQESELPQRYRYIIKSKDRGDRHFPVNAALFVLGCLFPPLWFIGCCWKSQNVYENAWRKANICMTIISLIAFTIFTIFMTLLMLEERENLPPTNPGDLPNLPPI